MQPSSRIPTGEFDTVVVCQAGVFAFEVKNWNHASLFREQEKTTKQWCLRYGNGEVKKVCDPIAQGIEKRESLTQLLALTCAARSYVFLPGNDLRIDPKMPATLLGIKDLPYIPRLSKSLTRKSQRISATTVNEYADKLIASSQGLTLADHIENCAKYHSKIRNSVSQ